MRVRVFLRQPLFSTPIAPGGAAAGVGAGSIGAGKSGVLGGTGHVPRNAAVVEGTAEETNAFGVTVRADGYYDETGKSLPGDPATLILPSVKIDHVHVLG